MIRLDEKYNRDDFIAFLSNAFIVDFTRDIRPIHTQNLSAIENAYSLGKSDKLDLQVFEFEYAGSSKKRVALTKEAFKIMQDSLNYQALAIFHGKVNDDWRLSLMILNPKKTDSGKVSLSYSNPRRYSYFLGPNAKVNTPHRFLIKTGQVKDFDDLQSRFNVEIVTKEFFENYKKLFDRLLAYLQKDHAFQAFANNNGINTANFAKKLLGQIVFLYFLQRKGWLGAKKGDSVSQGDKNFIRALFNQSREKGVNFYNTYLEPLFYGALNKPAEKAASYYRDYFDSQIPFLNGGLFEPPQNYDWEKSFLHIPDKVFSKDPKNPEHGDGILDIFDMYNFTVDESDFLDKEVSVDPEMLGKVFENLLEENLRKGKGTYYTPREIVRYMCEESLVNFLATETNLAPDDVKNKYFPAYNILGDEKIEARDVTTSEQIIESLKGIKVVDPACGSGAFLVGMLQQITHLRHELEIRSKILGRRNTASSEYEIKKDTIQNCIHGVDIDPGAIEIAKLRLWLSLVVDYELEEIEPLPNLDYKIMQGNSLLEELVLGGTTIKLYDQKMIKKNNGSKKMQNLFEEETRVGLFDDEKDKVLKTMKVLQAEYFKTSDSKEKKRLRESIEKVEHELIEESVKSTAEELHNQKINIKALPGIGLPPGDLKKLEKISTRESQIFAILDELKRTGTKPFFLWHLYFAEVFEEKGGFDVVIANPPYGANIDDLMPNYRSLYLEVIKNYADIYKIFFGLGLKILKKLGVLTFITPNTYLAQPRYKDLRAFLLNFKIDKVVNLGDKVFEGVVVPTCISFVSNANPASNYMYSDVAEDSKYTGNLNDATALVISLDQVRQMSDFSLLQAYSLKKDEVILSKILDIRDAGIQYHRSGIGLKNKGGNDLFDRLFNADPNKFKKSHPVWYGKLINEYYISSSTNEYFNLNFRDILKSNESVSYSTEAFERKEKILWRQTAAYVIAVVDIQGKWFRNTIQCGWIRDDYKEKFNLKYVLALLNSKYLRFLYQKIVNESEGRAFPQVKVTHVKKLPIKIVDKKIQSSIVELVDKISTQYQDLQKIKQEIDQVVYSLYGLTEEEIMIVEGIAK